jgi:hypothetical protein
MEEATPTTARALGTRVFDLMGSGVFVTRSLSKLNQLHITEPELGQRSLAANFRQFVLNQMI